MTKTRRAAKMARQYAVQYGIPMLYLTTDLIRDCAVSVIRKARAGATWIAENEMQANERDAARANYDRTGTWTNTTKVGR